MGEIDDKIDPGEFMERIKSIFHLYYAYTVASWIYAYIKVTKVYI